MADVTPSVSVFEQVQLIAGLRWRILRNSLRKKNSRLDLIGLILTGVFSSVLVIGFCFAFYAGAHTFVSQGRSAARDVTDCSSIYVAQWNDREAHRLLAGAFARAPPDPGTFSRPVYSLDGFVELRFAPDAAVRCVGAAGLPARAAVFWMVPAFACQPRPGPDRTSRASGVSIEFRGPSAVCTLVQRFLVAPVCRAIPRGR